MESEREGGAGAPSPGRTEQGPEAEQGGEVPATQPADGNPQWWRNDAPGHSEVQ